MQPNKLLNKTRGEIVAAEILECRSLTSRLRGLLGTQTLPRESACWLIPCRSIHTFGMKYAIDVFFLDKQNRVVHVIKNCKPNRLSRTVWKARSVLEFKSAPARNIFLGDQLVKAA